MNVIISACGVPLRALGVEDASWPISSTSARNSRSGCTRKCTAPVRHSKTAGNMQSSTAAGKARAQAKPCVYPPIAQRWAGEMQHSPSVAASVRDINLRGMAIEVGTEPALSHSISSAEKAAVTGTPAVCKRAARIVQQSTLLHNPPVMGDTHWVTRSST